jgi:putative transposase
LTSFHATNHATPDAAGDVGSSHWLGVCRVLTEHGVKIAPSTYYAFRARPVSARAERDARLLVVIEVIYRHEDLGRGLAGVRKVWRLVRRQAALGPTATVVVDVDLDTAARCTVERLMRQAGLVGARRGARS